MLTHPVFADSVNNSWFRRMIRTDSVEFSRRRYVSRSSGNASSSFTAVHSRHRASSQRVQIRQISLASFGLHKCNVRVRLEVVPWTARADGKPQSSSYALSAVWIGGTYSSRCGYCLVGATHRLRTGPSGSSATGFRSYHCVPNPRSLPEDVGRPYRVFVTILHSYGLL